MPAPTPTGSFKWKGTGASSYQLDIGVPTGADRYIFLTFGHEVNRTVTSVSYGGQALTSLSASDGFADPLQSAVGGKDIFRYVLNEAVIAAATDSILQVTFVAPSTNTVFEVALLQDVDQAAPFSSFVWGDGLNASPAVPDTPGATVASGTGELGIGVCLWRDSSAVITCTSSGATELQQIASDGTGTGSHSMQLVTMPGAASISPSWTASAGNVWIVYAFSVKGTGGGAGATFDASLAASASASGQLTTQVRMATSVSGSGAMSAQLTTQIRAQSSLSAQASVAAQLTTESTLAASPAASASLSGALTTQLALVSSLAAAASITAPFTTLITFAAALNGVATVSAPLTMPASTLQTSLSGSVTSAAALTTIIRCAAALSGQASISAPFTTAIPLAAAMAASASAASALTTQLRLAAALSGAAVVSPDLTTLIRLLAGLSASGSVAAALDTGFRLPARIVQLLGQSRTTIALLGQARPTIALDGEL